MLKPIIKQASMQLGKDISCKLIHLARDTCSCLIILFGSSCPLCHTVSIPSISPAVWKLYWMPAESLRGNTLNVSAIILLIMASLTSTHTITHIETYMQPGADSDTKEVEVTLSVTEAINLCHLELCVWVQALWECFTKLGLCVTIKTWPTARWGLLNTSPFPGFVCGTQCIFDTYT